MSTVRHGSTVVAKSLRATSPSGRFIAFWSSSSSESTSYIDIYGWARTTAGNVSTPWSELNITVNSLVSLDSIIQSLGSISKGEFSDSSGSILLNSSLNG